MNDHVEGRHMMRIKSHGLGSSGKKGTPYVKLVCGDAQLPQLPVYIYITPKSKDMARRQLKVCGYVGDDLGDLERNPTLLAGNEIPVLVEVEEWQGQRQLKGQIDLGGIAKGQVAKLNELLGFGGKPSVTAPAMPTHSAPAQPPSDDEEHEDDIPF